MSSLLEMDPNILLSIVNLKLRDYYSSLDHYCDDVGVNKEKLKSRLLEIGYEYNKDLNQFK